MSRMFDLLSVVMPSCSENWIMDHFDWGLRMKVFCSYTDLFRSVTVCDSVGVPEW